MLEDYFKPLTIEELPFSHLAARADFSRNITVHTENNPIPSLDKFKIAIFGVEESRYCPYPGTMKAPDTIRKHLYKLSKIPGRLKIADLGNMKTGISFNDTLAGLSDVLVYLLEAGIYPVILGGSSALTPAIDKAMSKLKRKYVLATIDSYLDYLSDKDAPDSLNYLCKLVNGQGALEHLVNIGYQTQLNDLHVINRLLKKHSELVRVGDARRDLHLMEPLLRDSDVVVVDMSSVRQSDAPGTISSSPNGFYGEEICLLARYAGISDSLMVFSLFDVDPDLDVREQTSGLAAQVIWFFLEGFSQKQFETQFLDKENTDRFTKFHVTVDDIPSGIIFVKSNYTDRWWMELVDDFGTKRYIACSHEDYQKANRNELPDRWILGNQRI